MKLARIGPPGAERPCVVVDDQHAVDASDVVADMTPATLAEEARAKLAATSLAGRPRLSLDGVRVGPPIAAPGKIVAIGLNYADHAAESGQPMPTEPVVFMKDPAAVVGPNDDVHYPRGGSKVDWEVELAVVIGQRARYLQQEDEPLHYVAGYCVANDVSERAFQLERGGQWDKGKSCETFCPLGPWLVTPDEVGDPQQLRMWLDVNDEPMQRGTTSTMVFGVAEIIRYVSQFMVLNPGDVLITGTPPGVGMGMSPPRYLKPGDRMSLGIDRLGSQTQHVVVAP